jgi:hypothetical protein
MKTTKKLITSIACLLASLAICVWACYAWFTVSQNVHGSGINATIAGGDDDIVDIEVAAYQLEYNSDKTAYKVSGDALSLGESNLITYDGDENTATAVLLEIKYQLSVLSKKEFKICAATANYSAAVENRDGVFISPLSNVVSFWKTNVTNLSSGLEKATFATYGDAVSYFSGNFSKSSQVTIIGSIGASYGADGIYSVAQNNGLAEHTAYVIMDYNSELFGNIFSQVLANGGNMSSQVNFIGDVNDGDNRDISIEIGEFTSRDEIEIQNVYVGFDKYSGTLADGTSLASGITTNGEMAIKTTAKSVTLHGNSSATSLTNFLQFAGGGSATSKSLSITTTGAAKIYVYSISSNSSDTRYLKFWGDNLAETKKQTGTTEVAESVFSVDSAGVYYLASAGSNINIYYLMIIYGE